MDIKEAIAFLKEAGYSVTKPRQRKSKLTCVGPTFRAVWPDGEVTRMTIHCNDESPDIKRAVRVSWAAYESRCRRLNRTAIPDHIIDGSFERDGVALHNYTDIDVPAYL